MHQVDTFIKDVALENLIKIFKKTFTRSVVQNRFIERY